MSRSNPDTNLSNPCQRWHQWSGSEGNLFYYDKTEEKNIIVPEGFTFILLDVLATIKGWHDSSDSGIFSNEIRDTKQETLVVKSFKGGTLAEGLYQSIKDKVKAFGGNYTQNCYVAFKDGDGLSLGSVQFKGASLNSWIEFSKAHRTEIYEQAVKITGYTEGTKGKITFRVPEFSIVPLSLETNNEAVAVDKGLQSYLKAYLGKTKTEQVEQAPKEPVYKTVDEDGEPLPF